MNENLDLTKILDGCPKGTKFYSSLFGEVKLNYIYGCRIGIECERMYILVIFDPAGRYEMVEMGRTNSQGNYYYSDECLLFPSKYQRDWSKFERFWDKPKVKKFDIKTLQPFDKVLVRDYPIDKWGCDFFSYIDNTMLFPIMGGGLMHKMCIPYNDDTKHLIGTKDDCPEYYKWWEE